MLRVLRGYFHAKGTVAGVEMETFWGCTVSPVMYNTEQFYLLQGT